MLRKEEKLAAKIKNISNIEVILGIQKYKCKKD
jgi:hypothetical protein